MATPNDNIKKLYENGLKHFSLPDFETFKADMKDEQKRKRFYDNMQQAYSLPDFNTFSTDIGAVEPPQTMQPQQAQPSSAQPQASTEITPVKDTTAQSAQMQPTTQAVGNGVNMQPQQGGWKPTPMQQLAFEKKVEAGKTRLREMDEQFQQRMDGIQKGNRPNASAGEAEFNPQTGVMETNYYTTQGDRVGTQVEQSRQNAEYNHWWEENTEEGKKSKERRLQREFDDRLAHLWQRQDMSEGENAAEKAWNAAEARHAKTTSEAARQIDNAPMLGDMESATIGRTMQKLHEGEVSRMTNFDLDRLMNDAWDNLGEEGQKSLIDDCYKMLKQRNPGEDEIALYNHAKEFARQQSNLRLYNLAVEKNRPANELEYLGRKIKDSNMIFNISRGIARAQAGSTGDMAAYEAANEQYRQDGHKILDVAGMVAGFALDPTTWVAGGAGGVAGKGALSLGGRWLAGRGATAAVRKAMTNQFATSMTGRIVGGIAGGAANFGMFEGMKEAESQFAHGGKVATTDEDGNLLREGRYVNEGYSAGAVGKQALHGLVMGAAIGWLTPVSGNVSDKLVRGGKIFGKEVGGVASMAGKVATRAGVYAGSTIAEGTIFSVPEWLEGNRDGFDVWTDNMAMMVGFKTKHMLKSAGGVLGDLKASFDSPTNGGKNRLDFESRLRIRTDSPSDGGMSLTKDEEAELKRYGYDLKDLVKNEFRHEEWVNEEGDMAPWIVSRLSDMVQDPRISEAARAKMYYYATGRMLPMSTVMRGELVEDGNGGFIVESQGANGVITSRSFNNRKSADLELERINRQVELNQIELGERYQQNAEIEKRLQEACRTVAGENGWNAVGVYRICEDARRNHLKGVDKDLDEARQTIVRRVIDAMGEIEETGVTDAMRGSINEKYGVDIDSAIRKEANRRTQDEQIAIQEYINELIPNKAKENPVEYAYAEDISDQKLLMNDEPRQPDGEQKPLDQAVTESPDEGVPPNDVSSDTSKPPYTSGQIKIRNSDGTESRGRLTGEVITEDNYEEFGKTPDDVGKHEYYVEGGLKHLYYATEEELDAILSEYKPDAPQELIIPKDSQGNDLAVGDEVVLSAGRTGVVSEIKPDGSVAVDHNGETVTYNEQFGDITATGLRKVAQTPPVEEALATPTDTPAEPINPTPEPTPAPAQMTEGAVLPNGITAVGSINVPQRDGNTRTFTIGKNAEGENVVLDESGFLWGHDGNGANMQPHRPGNNVPTWTDEQIAQFGAFETPSEQPTTVPKNAETVPNPAENAAPVVENEPETVSTVDPTPLQRIPRDEKGEPVFEQSETPELGWDALLEFSEGDVATAKEIADTMIEEKRKAFEKAQKLKSKGKTPSEILASRKANEAELAKAQAEYEHWQGMAAVEQARQKAIQEEQAAEARRLAEERARREAEEKKVNDEAARIEREKHYGIPEWHMDTPENARARGSRRFSGQIYTRQEPLQGLIGREVEVKFSQEDLPKGHVAVIEASQLQPSHIQGQRNPMFFIDEAQPKNRGEGVSTMAAQKIAEGIRPEEITGGATAYTGAPTVNMRGEVIQGNNRSDALRYLWDNSLPEQQNVYKQYLIDNADKFGIDAKTISSMRNPVLVNMLDVDDADAIRLGQMTAQDTESGGIERIKPKNVAQKMGENMRTFANMLLRSTEDESTFGQLVDSNGAEVLKWMNQTGAITSTQYQSAFDSKGNITAEAKNDLQKVLYQAVFKGGSPQLEEMFEKLPSKAQRAILGTAFRDMDSPVAGRMLPEIQASIVAFNQMMNEPSFASAKNMESVLTAIEGFKRTYTLDDRLEQHAPSDNFSNFALHLAGLYKASDMSQTTITSYFNQMYDFAQGKKEASLFEEADTTQYPLAKVINKVLNIEYKPARNGSNNVANGGADVALRNQVGQGGELRGDEPPSSGEQTPSGTESSERGTGAADDSTATGGRGDLQPTDERQTDLQPSEEINATLSEEEKDEYGKPLVLAKDGTTTFGIIDAETGLTEAPIRLSLGENTTDDEGKNHGYGLLHIEAGHGNQIRNAGYASVEEFVEEVAKNYTDIREGALIGENQTYLLEVSDDHNNTLFIQLSKDGTYWNVNSAGIFKKKYSRRKPKVYSVPAVGEDTNTDTSEVDSGQTEGVTAPAGNSSQTSDSKDIKSLTEEQISGEESSWQPSDDKGAGVEKPSVQASVQVASAEVNTEPTPAQAEAGNYKKGHVTIGDFDIAIENPAGSVRKGVDADGKSWETTMSNAYGYIKGTESVDGDPIDVFLHTDMDKWNGRKVYVVDQTRPDGSFDEHKVMLGFNGKDEAMSAYLANYDNTWAEKHPGLRISEVSTEDFNKWIQSSHRKTKPFAEYSSISKIADDAPLSLSDMGATDNSGSRPHTASVGEIEDFGEKIAGARKDMLSAFGKTVESVTEQSLIELPLSKAFKKPNLKQMVKSGAITDGDARLAEAVMQALIYGVNKPKLTKRYDSKRELTLWAKNTHGAIRMLGDILSGDAERRDAALALYEEAKGAVLAEAQAKLEKIRGWNPDHVFKDIESLPDPLDIMKRVLDAIGYEAGDKVDLPLSRIDMDSSYQYYKVKAPGKQGSLWFRSSYATLDEAVDAMILAARLASGDREVELPMRQYTVRGEGSQQRTATGRFEVLTIGKRGSINSRIFESEDEAKAYADTHEGLLRPEERRSGEYDSYRVVAINPLTGNSHDLKNGFESRTAAGEWLDSHHEDANQLAVNAICDELGKKSGPKAHFRVEATYDRKRQRRIYSVLRDDKNNPWPVLKDFDSREEAEKWLAENKERLEEERKERIRKLNSVVYFKDAAGKREGKDYRGGKDATPQMYEEAFGFRGVQFGNWTKQEDRQAALNEAYDGFMDLAQVLGLDGRDLSLDGELGLAFGARGSGMASAHYEPVEVVINLSKTRGAGALAHEWWHALDNYISRKGGVAYGYGSHENGLEGVSGRVGEAMRRLMSTLSGSDYMKRSRLKGDYWGRGTEVTARLFAEWVKAELDNAGVSSPFLSDGVRDDVVEVFRKMNYSAYRMDEKRKAKREGREPEYMSYEEFCKNPRSLNDYPYPTKEEIAEFGGLMRGLFGAMSERKEESGSMVMERGGRYGRSMATNCGMSLFDWADKEEQSASGLTQHQKGGDAASADGATTLAEIDEDVKAAEDANAGIDRFVEEYTDYLGSSAEYEQMLENTELGENERRGIEERLDHAEVRVIEARAALEERLRDYYVRNNTPEDAEMIARDMRRRVEAEVEIRKNGTQLLHDILEGTDELKDRENPAPTLTQQDGENRAASLTQQGEVKTAGGIIGYQAIGHLPDAKKGEFAYIERKFSRSGEFNFTGGEKLRDRGDVAYLFRALESYSIENVFAVMVKDGSAKVCHLGMGGPTASAAYLGAMRAMYDAFGADEIYLVHNHPSGKLQPSIQDQKLMEVIETAFGDIKSEGLIIDTRSGRYGKFRSSGGYEVFDRPRTLGNENSDNAGENRASALTQQEVLRFDRMEHSEDAPKELRKITSSRDVSDFISELRFRNDGKLSYLILSNANEIIGNFHTDHVEARREFAEELVSMVTRFGGTGAVVYGGADLARSRRVGELVKELSLNGIKLVDFMKVENESVASAVDMGYMYEPESKYGASADGDVRFRIREDKAPEKTGIGYKVFVLKDGKLYPPMVANPGGESTPVGVWLDADAAPVAGLSKTGRQQVKAGGKGTQGGSGKLAYRPGWHLGEIPYALQFNRVNAETGQKELFPANFVWAEVEYSKDIDYQDEAMSYGYNANGKFQHSYAGLPRLPKDGFYTYRTNPNPETDPWIITGAMKVNRLLTPTEVDEMVKAAGREPQQRQSGAVSDSEISRLNGEIAKGNLAQTSLGAKRGYAEELSNKFNTPIRIVEDPTELTHDDPEMQKRMRNSKGFYNPATGEVVVVVPNNATVEDVAETVFHEVVAHKGLRELVGEENYDAFCDEIYGHLKDDLKQQIDEKATQSFINEPEKGHEHHQRVAVDEMFGRLSEKGFEDFTKAERGIWAKLKAKVLEAINKFLGSLKLPKWVTLGDNELRYMLWKSHERLRGKDSVSRPHTAPDYVDMARDVAIREELGLNDGIAMRGEIKKAANNEARLNDLDPAADRVAKIANKIESTKKMLHRLADTYRETTEPKGFLTDLSKSLGAIVGLSGSGYRTFELKDGSIIKIRISTHNANSENARVGEPVVSIVIKPKRTPNTFVGESGKDVSEYVYFKEDIRKAPAGTLSEIADSVADVLDTGKYIDRTGLAKENHSEIRFRDGETGDIWKDRSVGLEERITNAAIRLAQNQAGDLTLRNDAMRAVTNNLQSLLHTMRNRGGRTQSFAGADRKVERGVVGAMNAQAMYDRSTVKRVADLARILMQHGYLSGMTSGEMQRLLSAVKNSAGMHDTSEYIGKIMDIMVENQLRNGEGTLRQLLNIKGSKVDARGVEVQGALDVDGQRTMEVVKKAMSLNEDDINDRIAEALNRMSDSDQTIADQATIEYAGLSMALDYVQNIAESKAEEKALRDSLKAAKEERDAGRMTEDAYKQYVEATEDAIRKNKIERAEAYFNITGRLSDSLRGSIENAKAFREAEKARVNEIHHNANSDMEGRPTNEHHKDDWKDKFVNNGFAQFLFSPLATFDQVLRVFGNKSASGEGYLWNKFMRGWVAARNKELTGVKDKFAQLDEKAAELFGKGNTWGSIIRMESKLPKATVSFWDGGEMRDHELSQGNLLYIYMVDKMSDGRMKLRRMGITEQDIADIESVLDPRFKKIGDWLQDEFLVSTRNEYNETHKRMFGASMAAIENYFPLKILANARIDKEEDVNQPNRPDGITTKTGSIIKRRVNNLALDITGADALSVILDHITQMEHWNAYAEWNRDLNTLRTYKRFRNQVINMTTVYGGGRKLWDKFNDLCLMAAGEYRPPIAALDKSAVNIAKGVTAAKVSFRMFTALKQFLSAPAYAPEVSARSIAKSIANPYGDFKWCMENMPIFRERWQSRISGDPRLLKNEKDWNMWRSRVMEICSRIGMTPNAFVDAVTVSIGAKAMYDSRKKQYLGEGYPADAAEERAKQDAAILFNQTQQSSESPFLSTMQVDRSWLSVMFTVFRNSSMSYTRQQYDAMRNLKRNLTPGQRAKSIEFMEKQILRDWDAVESGGNISEYCERFNEQLKKYSQGLLPVNERVELGYPCGAMSIFLPDLPIVMGQRVLHKGVEKKHNIDPEGLRDMPRYLSNPIFVFSRSENTIGVLTEMRDRKGKNVCVAIDLSREIQKGGDVLVVNDIRSVHGRETENVVLPIVNNGTLRWVDKDKGLKWLSSASQQVQQEIAIKDLDDAAKIVENFENPKSESQRTREEKARKAAEQRFSRQIRKDVIRVATFGFVLEMLWNLGPYLPYLIFGNDDVEKDKMWDDAMTHSYFGSLEGLTGGDVMSSFGNMAASGEWSFNQLTKDMPIASDINSIGNKFIGGKNAEALNDIINLLVQSGVGMNPQSITDGVMAIMDACGDDPALSHEAAIFVMRVLQVPQSQLDKLYFDEIGLSGDEASKLAPAQLAQRYAEYKVKRGTPLAPWSWDDEERLDKHKKVAEERMKERLESQGGKEVNESYAGLEERYEAVKEKMHKAKQLMETDYVSAAKAYASLQHEPDMKLYHQFKVLDKQLDNMSKMWLKAQTPEEASLVGTALRDYRAGMVKVLEADGEEAQKEATADLSRMMSEFYAKYQEMQPQRM